MRNNPADITSLTARAAITSRRRWTSPRVYIAGKIGKNDFRHAIIPRLREWRHEYGSLACGGFTYVGPFFSSCDHGCRHGPSSHGVTGNGCEEPIETREGVYTRNQTALYSADLVFAYIDATDCHGTLFELGCAKMADIPVTLTFAPGIDIDDFWYARQASAKQRGTSVYARADLPFAFANALNFWWRGG